MGSVGRTGKSGVMKRNIARERSIQLSQIRKRHAKGVAGEDFNVLWQPRPRDKRII